MQYSCGQPLLLHSASTKQKDLSMEGEIWQRKKGISRSWKIDKRVGEGVWNQIAFYTDVKLSKNFNVKIIGEKKEDQLAFQEMILTFKFIQLFFFSNSKNCWFQFWLILIFFPDRFLSFVAYPGPQNRVKARKVDWTRMAVSNEMCWQPTTVLCSVFSAPLLYPSRSDCSPGSFQQIWYHADTTHFLPWSNPSLGLQRWNFHAVCLQVA